MSSHSVAANCEEDETEGALSTLWNFIQGNDSNSPPENVDPGNDDVSTVEGIGEYSKVSFVANETTEYVSGYIGKKI